MDRNDRELELIESDWAYRRFDKWMDIFRQSPLDGISEHAFAAKMVEADVEFKLSQKLELIAC